MPTVTKTKKAECLNPNTGGRMNIDKDIYDLFSKAICHTLNKEGAATFTQLVEGVENFFKKQKTKFDGSIGWYAVTVKNDMQARHIIEVVKEKGKTLNRLSK
ncbi:DUF6958 family protein [Flavisolibacter ginsenosidimutans]|uniref:Uncharacterized protein n=1 Tax=Flavisolibacter ginsenosidimutans TaxID=661481 RepID=A0A5B8UL20_9BACT|nr:hypothetical protein [Flavisolibacter ginsenosidimutans]QEC57072.1 hypothetical protein FSB75_14560 [Flavisolibacter ginsenosidimutans]